jgi:hypothetical protein
MSFFVEIDRDSFPDTALNGFAPEAPPAKFNLGNAQAMMWMSQLAYETGHRQKVESILDGWRMDLKQFASNDPITGLPPHSACFVAASGRNATVITFAGTDPLKIQEWITDFSPLLSPDDLHGGFEAALDSVWSSIKPVIAQRSPTDQPLFFTGHSMGAALALIAAERAARELGTAATATAVYAFGCPRVGGQRFFDRYTPALGDRTFRLVYGTDIVATVPPTQFGGFRHVGCCVQCVTDSQFAEDAPTDRPDQNAPDILESTLLVGQEIISGLAPIESVGPRLLGGPLPPMVRDHIPASYFRALSIPLR